MSPHSTSTSGTLTNNTLRLAPWYVPVACAIDRLGGDIATVGEAGSKVRLGIYGDNGTAYPGALVLDGGQIAGDSATVQELTVSLTLSPGLYWIGGVVQSATTTQPTVRINNNWYGPVMLALTTSAPAASATATGYAQSSVSGALPANFTTSVTASGSAPRCHVRFV